jgi:ABC-type multidrug transport system fused ATPase/permease subunit
MVIRGALTLGDIALLGTYTTMLMRPMGVIGGTWASLQDPIAGLRRIHSVLDRLGERDDAPDRDAGSPAHVSDLEFRDVTLGYADAEPVLRNVSIALHAGAMVALAGPSGVGKSTLIYAIPHFLEPQSGAISINGTDLRELAPALVRRRIGFVFQQEALFSASIADNIRYGKPDATDGEIRQAAAMAGAAEFIAQLADGYATMLGRRGTRLSVGQKQRVAIARALVRQPDVLILDEPTAPLDPASESDLIATLRRLARDRIVLIVAHRAETLAACDRVYFISDSTISASGTHDELLASCPAYRSYLAITDSEIHG